MKAFITGANGFIGSNLTKKLIENGHKVKALVLYRTDYKNLIGTGCEIVHGDILNVSDFEDKLKGQDVIFHLAAKVSDWGKWEDFYKLNVQATKKLITIASFKGVKRFVFISSLAIHKPTGYLDGNEEAPRNNRKNPYALSKIMAEDVINEFQENNLIETVIIRPGVFPFGPEDRTSFYHIAKAMEKGIFGYVNKGKSVLCTAYIENLVDGIILAAEKYISKGKTYVIGDNIKITWLELITLFAKYLGLKPPKLSLPYTFAKTIALTLESLYKLLSIQNPPPLTDYRISLVARDFFFNSEKAIKELGYMPTVPIEEGVRRTVDWYKKQVE